MAECPVTLNHTDGPSGYLARSEWAEEMSKTHRQKKCRSCGLYKIWVPKPSRPAKANPDGAGQPRTSLSRETDAVPSEPVGPDHG